MSSGYVAQKIAAASKRSSPRSLLARLAKERLEALKASRSQQSTKYTPESILSEYRDDPVRFAEEVLGRKLWAKQVEIAESVVRHRRTATRSGHKVGKTELASALAIWWATTRPNARAIVTAPTDRQVREAFWSALRRMAIGPDGLASRGINILPEPALDPATGIRWEDGRRLFGFTASNADKVSGPSGAEILFIVDEASGVPNDVWQAVQGIMGGAANGRVLAIGNPTQPSGWFYDAFNEKRDGWNPLVISSEESPNVVEKRTVIPGLADPDWVAEMLADYGADSPIFQVRVRGNFPTSAGNQVIGLGLIELARASWDIAKDDGASLDIGVDVARFGDDDSAICARRGLKVYSPAWFERRGIKSVVNGYDSTKLTGVALQCMGELRKPGERVRIKVDVTGGFGEPVVAMLRALQDTGQLDQAVRVMPVNFAGASSDAGKFPVVRDELWFGGRAFFRDGGALFPDPKLESELIAPTYGPDLKGRNKVEPKRDTKKRIGRSPDRADAALLAIYEPGNTTVEEPDPLLDPMSRWEDYDDGEGRGF
jgi:phage terminase large subunit